VRRHLLIALLCGASLAAFGQAALPTRPEQLPKAAPLTFTPPQVLRESLPNGLTLLMLPDHSLPLVRLFAVVRAGSIYDPPDKVGLAEVSGAALETGGTQKFPADRMQETLEALAAQLQASVGEEYGQVSLDLLSKDLNTGLPIFADLLVHPACAQEKLAIEKARISEELKRQNEEPWLISDIETKKLLYGPASPWARTPKVQDVEKISREDVLAFHARYFTPSGTLIAAAGDFDPERLSREITELLGGWPARKVDLPPVAAAPAEDKPSVVVMDKPDLTQATLFVAELCGKRGRAEGFNQDRYAMDVMNFILGGGGFTSRLTKEIRSNRGLAYTVRSSYSFGTDRGTFAARCQTGVGTTAEACSVIRDTVKAMTEKPPSDEELALAKESLLNVFVFNYQNAGRIVLQSAIQDFYGFPADYMASYPERIGRVTADDCLKVAQKYLHPDRMTTVVLGPAQKLKEPMQSFGTVEVKALPEP
jgi:zinc protease